ncbi:MAG: site-specific integrase [Candidatus Jettenia sp. AMX1]|nr:site-specific integrase [Candidatus Jettenia sp. AMX1]
MCKKFSGLFFQKIFYLYTTLIYFFGTSALSCSKKIIKTLPLRIQKKEKAKMDFGLHKRNRKWYYDFYINNVRYRGSTKTSSRELAIQFARKIYNELYLGKYELKNNLKVKLEDIIQEYIFLNKNNFCKDWLQTKQWKLNNFLKYMTDQGISYLDQITVSHLEHYKAHLLDFRKPHTVKNTITIISTLLNFAVNLGYINNNPAKKLNPIRGIQKNKQRFLSKEEISKVLDVTKGTYLENLVKAAVYTGMRRRELLYLQYQDIDICKMTIHIKNKQDFTIKSKGERILPLHKNLESVFNGVNGDEYCFKKDGKIIHEDRASRNFIELVEKVGLTDIGLHTLRHTFILRYLYNKVLLDTN